MEHYNLSDTESIAIIGMACRFPGAETPEQYWQNLVEGRETITAFTEKELAQHEYDFAHIKDKKNYVRSRGILTNIETFDAAFFGLSPQEAATLDPQQRIWLECAWEALEHACQIPEKYQGTIGVYAGAGFSNYFIHNICQNRDYIEKFIRRRTADAIPNLISNSPEFLPTRTSYLLNLQGPSVNVQTGCSTSLVAVCHACQSLLQYDTDICLAGGVALQIPQITGYLYQEGGMTSPDGHCRPFDENAAGTVFSNGAGVIVLKRADEALADGDTIYAVIKAAAINNDGSNKVSFTAPSVQGQADVISTALSLAEIKPEEISFVETHGTGTPLGDPIEFAGLSKALSGNTGQGNRCALGSVKSNIGHLDTAAGIAGLIKTALALYHKKIPATLHFHKPNPEIDMEQSPFYINNSLIDWKTEYLPRKAGVSSFGIGGTNAHVILEEAPLRPADAHNTAWNVFPFSAKTETALAAQITRFAAYLEQNPAVNLNDLAYSLHTGRKDFEKKICFSSNSYENLLHSLKHTDISAHCKKRVNLQNPALVFMFPGQGSQHSNMGREIYKKEAVFRQHVDRCAEILQPLLQTDIREILYPKKGAEEQATETLQNTAIAQPALFVIEYALAMLWSAWGIKPKAMIGHSVGEYVAACLAGVFSLEDALRVLSTRAQLMQNLPGGAMLAVKIPEDELRTLLSEELSIAAHNAPSLYIISGPDAAVGQCAEKLHAKNIETRKLHTSHAFHSSMMDPILEEFTKIIAGVTRNRPTLPFISSITGTWIREEEARDPSYWAEQLRHTVQFHKGIRELSKEETIVLLEVGPSTILTTAARQQLTGSATKIALNTLPHAQAEVSALATLYATVGNLWLSGIKISWQNLYKDEQRKHIPLPTYAFERQRYWIDVTASTVERTRKQEAMPVESTRQEHAGEPPVTEAQNQQPQHGTLRNTLQDIFYKVSGIEINTTNAEHTFLELGFDSLSLSQVSVELENQLQVTVRFRQLLEELHSFSLLTTYIEKAKKNENNVLDHENPPFPNARLGKNAEGNPAWFIPDPDRPGKYLQVGKNETKQ